MQTVQIVHCPTCGALAERLVLPDRDPNAAAYPTDTPTAQRTRPNPQYDGQQIIQTTCAQCDYRMILNGSTGHVLEAYTSKFRPRLRIKA